MPFDALKCAKNGADNSGGKLPAPSVEFVPWGGNQATRSSVTFSTGGAAHILSASHGDKVDPDSTAAIGPKCPSASKHDSANKKEAFVRVLLPTFEMITGTRSQESSSLGVQHPCIEGV